MYDDLVLTEDNFFKSGNYPLKFGLDEVHLINDNIGESKSILSGMTGLSESTVYRIVNGLKRGVFNKFLNDPMPMVDSIGDDLSFKDEVSLNISGGVHIIINNAPVGGVEQSKQVNTIKLRNWSRKIKIRGNYVCAKCGKHDKRHNQAHHIFPKSRYPYMAYDEGNGIVLCQKCHDEYHKEYQGLENAYNFIGWLNR